MLYHLPMVNRKPIQIKTANPMENGFVIIFAFHILSPLHLISFAPYPPIATLSKKSSYL